MIEILIAMFVFMFGILGVLSMFPVAMSSASRSIGRVRGNIIAQSVFAQLQVDCRVPFIEGYVASSTASQIQCAMSTPYPIPSVDEWNGYFVTITSGGVAQGQSRLILDTDVTIDPYALSGDTLGATLTDTTPQAWAADEHIGKWVRLNSGAESGEYRIITDNDATTLTLSSAFDTDPMVGLDYDIIELALDVCPNWNPEPADGDGFVVTRMGLPSLPRGTVASYTPGTPTTLVSSDLIWADDQWNGFYVVMLDGDAKGEFHKIADTIGGVPPTTVELASDFTAAPLSGDTFAIVRIAPTSLPRGTITDATSPPDFQTDLNCTDGQWDGFLLKMLDGSQEGQVSYIGDTAAANGQLTLRVSPSEPSFTGDPGADDTFEIQNPSVRIGYIREFVDQDAFYAGFADHSDQTVGPLSWSAPWRVAPGSSDLQDLPIDSGTCAAGTDADHLQVVDASSVLPGHIAVITGPAGNDAVGQTRLVTGKSVNTLDVFPTWSVTPTSGTDEYEIRRSLGHFLVITTGRSAGKVVPITEYLQDTTNTNGDRITCAGVRFRELGVTEAQSGTQYNLRNATGFMIVGGDTFLGTVTGTFITSSAGKNLPPATANSINNPLNYPQRDYGYALNTFGLPKTSEPQCGSDIHFEDTADRETSEFSSVCVFSEGDALNEGPVRVDVFVFRNFNSAVDLWENQKPAAHVTGYIGRP